MRLTFEISKEELLAALVASQDSDTIAVSASPKRQAVPTNVTPAQLPATKTAAPAGVPAATAPKGKPGRKSNAQKEAEAAAQRAAEAAAAAAESEQESDDEELHLDSVLADGNETESEESETSEQDELEAGLLEDDEPAEDEPAETIENDQAARKKIAEALQAHKKRHGGKAQGATDILRRFAPSLSVPNVKKKDVNALLKALSK